jgi:acyl dehydratase
VARVISARDTRFGGYLEDYQPGDIYRHWPGKTITEAEDHMFCLLTLAASPLHVDRNYGENESEFGRNVVVGTFIYSLLLGMSVPDISGRAIANLGVSELRHLAPFFHGDTLYGSTEILSVRPSASRPAQGILTVRTEGMNQDERKVCSFTRAVLLPRRPASAA